MTDHVDSRRVLITLAIWLAAAVALGLSGLYRDVPAPVIGATNVILVALSLAAVFRIPALRAWAERVSLRGLVLYHTVRFVGVAFLMAYADGLIPGVFAIVAGWGDIAVAVSAIAVAVWAVPVTTAGRWWVVMAWNVFGLLDILMVLGNGMRLGLGDAASMNWITTFPWMLLPTIIVPLVIVSHVLIFGRLAAMYRVAR